MSRKALRSITNYFKNPLVEGKYPVIPPPTIPLDIVKPAYATSSKPIFGEYENPARPHTEDAIKSSHQDR